MIYDNLGSEIYNFLPKLHTITGSETMSNKVNVGMVNASKNVCKHPSKHSLIKLLGKNISAIDEIIPKAKIFVHTNL